MWIAHGYRHTCLNKSEYTWICTLSMYMSAHGQAGVCHALTSMCVHAQAHTYKITRVVTYRICPNTLLTYCTALRDHLHHCPAGSLKWKPYLNHLSSSKTQDRDWKRIDSKISFNFTEHRPTHVNLS